MSWCNCSVDPEGDSADFCSATIRTARKEHKCFECGHTIRVGRQYEHVTGKWENRIDTFRTCMTCLRIRERFCPNGFYYGGLDDALQEGIHAPLETVRMLWADQRETIAGLVDLVCELLEGGVPCSP